MGAVPSHNKEQLNMQNEKLRNAAIIALVGAKSAASQNVR